MRNALHYAITRYTKREDWFDHGSIDPRAQKIVRDAKDNIKRNNGTIDTPHIVAELSFGFWVSLLNKQYHQTLWIPALGKAFPHAHRKRTDIHDELNHVRLLRNRIAHHEPVFNRHLAMDYKKIIEITGWINPVKAEWIDHHNNVQTALARHP